MTHSISISEAGNRVVVRTVSITTLDLAKGVLTATVDALLKTPPALMPQLLFDMRDTPNRLSVLDNYRLAYEFASRMVNFRRAAIAILRDAGDTSYSFSETLARNIGMTARVFTDEVEADAWLVEKAKAHAEARNAAQ